MYDDWGWRPYVPVAERRRQALRKMEQLRKKGHPVSPVTIEGRTIVKTFWGKAWCDNLESYSDFANRLPRGRTYVRNGSVVDLQIGPGEIKALVSGSEIYKVSIRIAPVGKARWATLCQDCAGGIDSLVELLQGRFSKGVMERMCRQKTGLFPSPQEIKLSCSCPDWAEMCKHVAAVLYGIGARLDSQPELLFRLHRVDENELIAQAGTDVPLAKHAPAAAKIIAEGDVSAIFGLDMAPEPAPSTPATRTVKRSKPQKPATKNTKKQSPASKRQAEKPATPGKRGRKKKAVASAAGGK
jgi:uncharacterized Zn finger protein